jgi:hypothetical protein
MNVPEIWSSVPNRKFFQKKFGSLNIVNGAVKLVHNVEALAMWRKLYSLVEDSKNAQQN